MKTQSTKPRSQKLVRAGGFTLIELLVAVSIFSVVIIIAVGAILNLTKAANRSHAVLTAINNLDFAMEQMGRTVRIGTDYYCTSGSPPITADTQDCTWTVGKSTLAFTDKEGDRIAYEFNVTKGSLERVNLSAVPVRIFDITSPEVFIESLTFNVFGSSNQDAVQPRVLMRIKGHTNVTGLKAHEQVVFDLQTTVSQRKPDL